MGCAVGVLFELIFFWRLLEPNAHLSLSTRALVRVSTVGNAPLMSCCVVFEGDGEPLLCVGSMSPSLVLVDRMGKVRRSVDTGNANAALLVAPSGLFAASTNALLSVWK